MQSNINMTPNTFKHFLLYCIKTKPINAKNDIIENDPNNHLDQYLKNLNLKFSCEFFNTGNTTLNEFLSFFQQVFIVDFLTIRYGLLLKGGILFFVTSSSLYSDRHALKYLRNIQFRVYHGTRVSNCFGTGGVRGRDANLCI